MLGGANYLGDLSENSQKLFLNETGLGAGVFVGYNIAYPLTLRFNANFMQISGTDANAEDELILQRNLHFQSNIIEASIRAEWNITGFNAYNYYAPFSPYLFAGVGGFNFNPKTDYNGNTIQLNDIGTEGQGIENYPSQYGLTQIVLPFGLGVKYALTESWTIGLEVGSRFIFTDYLDDVSGEYANYNELLAGNGETAVALAYRQGELDGTIIEQFPTTKRGDDNSRDYYFFTGITIAYNFIDNGIIGGRKRIKRRKDGCRTD